MKFFTKFLHRLDSIAPNPWHIDSVEQGRPIIQLGFMLGVVVGLIICYFYFN